MTLSERAAYIKGLAEGMELEADRKEVRLLKEMLELLGEMASGVEDIGSDLAELCDTVDQMDEDLSLVEDEVFGEAEGDFQEEMYEITCPHCEETVRIDEDMLLGGDVQCPMCGEKIEVEIDACDCGQENE